MSRLRAALRAYPTLLRVGLSEAVAYRAETIIWMLTNTMPLVNLALWHSVAGGGAIAGYRGDDLVAYFLGALVVRQLTGSWVLWEMSQEIRKGVLSLRLLRPVHPLIAYSAENLSAIPLRAGLALPLAVIAVVVTGGRGLGHDPVVWAMLPLVLVGAWAITFSVMALLGTLCFYIDSAMSAFEIWLALYFTLSGYLFPLEFLRVRAPWAVAAAKALPFYPMNGLPVEMMLGHLDRGQVLHALAVEWTYVAVFFAALMILWKRGIRRYEAYGA